MRPESSYESAEDQPIDRYQIDPYQIEQEWLAEDIEPGPDAPDRPAEAIDEAAPPEWSEDGGLAIPFTELEDTELEDAELQDGIEAESLSAEDAALSPTALGWRENPANPERDRYLDDVEAQTRLREVLRRSGFTDRALALVNPPGGDFASLRVYNCGECARAVASILNGVPRTACPLLPRRLADGGLEYGEESSTMEQALGRVGEFDRNFAGRRTARLYEVEHGRVDEAVRRQFDLLEAELLRDGPGSHATVGLIWKPFDDHPSGLTSGHWLNATNIDGTIVYIDGQRAARGTRDASFMRQYQQDAMGISWIRADRRHG